MKEIQLTGSVYSAGLLESLVEIDDIFKRCGNELKILNECEEIFDENGGDIYLIWEVLNLDKKQNKEKKYPNEIKVTFQNKKYLVIMNLSNNISNFRIKKIN
jgi:hypothetical protein